MSLIGSTNSEKMYHFMKRYGMPDCGIFGLMGNINCESGFNPRNLEDYYENKTTWTDDSYIAAVDAGTYTKFGEDRYGFGICQWTWPTRKLALLDYAKSKGVSIGDYEMQMEFLVKELQQQYPSVWSKLMSATSILEASNAVLFGFECPLDQSIAMQNKRAAYGKSLYEKIIVNKTNNGGTINMGYYTFTKGSKVKVSENFYSNEFDCHGYGCCKQTIINKQLVEYLQKIRDHFGSPITITSAYRCVVHNRNVGGATGSRHGVGDAADIVVANHTPAEVARYAESIGILGIGLYETNSDGHFVHIDTRNYRSFWYGQAQSHRTTFGGTSSNANKPVANNSQVNSKLIKYGDCGSAVKTLQEKLIKLGYSCGSAGADGSFGLGTKNAVISFQKKNGLDPDGIAGALTMAAINSATKESSDNDSMPYTAVVNTALLNVRSGAGTNNPIISSVRQGQSIEVIEESNGWGKIKAPSGWVSLNYCVKNEIIKD